MSETHRDAPPQLQRCALAFADAMGTSERSRDTERAEIFLGTLCTAVGVGRRVLGGERKIHGVRSSWFSDNVCLSVPHEGWRSVSTITQSVGTLAATFASQGVFLRGAVTVDLLYQEGDIAFGPGLTMAARAEKLADFPRVILLESACDLGGVRSTGCGVIPLAEDTEDGLVFVDFIQYARDDLPTIAARIAQALAEAEEIRADDRREKALRQLGWLDDYYKDSTGSARGARKRGPGRFRRLTVLP